MNRLLLALLVPTLLAACASSGTSAESAAPATAGATASISAPTPGTVILADLDAALQGDWRSAENRARDVHRHPRETLAFFNVAPDHTVVEITPGGGWYSEILAPYLARNGRYIAAVIDPAAQTEQRARDYYTKANAGLAAKFAADAERYGRAQTVAFDPKRPVLGAPGSADVVLTFRNVHNWRADGNAEAMFRGFFDVLRPGGVLGVVEHRAKADVPADDKTGYVGQAQVIAMAQAAGFLLDAQSEVNANPRDTKDHPNGVWTLPPVNRHDAQDAAKYRAIGESDRMTLRFVKPRA
ncbi:MAG TPA: methyltransferase [Lysobacter sp.]